MKFLHPGPNIQGDALTGGLGLVVILGLILMFLSLFFPDIARQKFVTLFLCTLAVAFLCSLLAYLRRKKP